MNLYRIININAIRSIPMSTFQSDFALRKLKACVASKIKLSKLNGMTKNGFSFFIRIMVWHTFLKYKKNLAFLRFFFFSIKDFYFVFRFVIVSSMPILMKECTIFTECSISAGSSFCSSLSNAPNTYSTCLPLG